MIVGRFGLAFSTFVKQTHNGSLNRIMGDQLRTYVVRRSRREQSTDETVALLDDFVVILFAATVKIVLAGVARAIANAVLVKRAMAIYAAVPALAVNILVGLKRNLDNTQWLSLCLTHK